MPSSVFQTPPLQDSHHHHVQALISSARPFLRGELETINPSLPSLVSVLRSLGAGECFHKHGSFLDHLVDSYRILKIWKAPEAVCLCGLFHSAYSNSYVNLAIFDPSTGREVVRDLVGEAAEALIHLFCIVPRQSLIYDDILCKYSDSELVEHLNDSENSLKNAKEKALFDKNEAWRVKMNRVLPENGVVVKHIRTGEDLVVSRRMVGLFFLMTMADFSDQYFGYQDELFGNWDGRFEFRENNFLALWPGNGKPGLWMNIVSRIGAVYSLIAREEEILMEEKKRVGELVVDKDRDEDIELVLPPVFDYCTKVLDANNQIEARDLYWEAMCGEASKEGGLERAAKLLLGSIDKNPFVGEPHVALGQVYLGQGRFEEAEKEVEKGLRLLVEWASPWDKRMSWEGWVAWARLLLMKAKDHSWPNTAWGILNLGLVR